MRDSADDESVEFVVFSMICYAVAVNLYGLDAIQISETQRWGNKYHRRRREARNNE